jgi:hypothetical protein
MRRAHEQEGATLSAHRRDGQPADGSRWRELSCHIIGMKDALDLVETTLAGEPLNAEVYFASQQAIPASWPQCIIGTQISGISDRAGTPKVPLVPQIDAGCSTAGNYGSHVPHSDPCSAAKFVHGLQHCMGVFELALCSSLFATGGAGGSEDPRLSPRISL